MCKGASDGRCVGANSWSLHPDSSGISLQLATGDVLVFAILRLTPCHGPTLFWGGSIAINCVCPKFYRSLMGVYGHLWFKVQHCTCTGSNRLGNVLGPLYVSPYFYIFRSSYKQRVSYIYIFDLYLLVCTILLLCMVGGLLCWQRGTMQHS